MHTVYLFISTYTYIQYTYIYIHVHTIQRYAFSVFVQCQHEVVRRLGYLNVMNPLKISFDYGTVT